jgi:fermentation-respiration switch protein FrsA (DUF1100 family)
MKTFLITILIVYLSICLILYFIQEKFIFHPVKLASEYQFTQFTNAEERYFTATDGHKIHALHFRVHSPKGIVLYFHGNSGALDDWGYAATDFNQKDYEVMMPDYPTYGKSTGKLSESLIYEDALTVYHALLKSWSSENIILYGRSLGSGVATELATKVEAKLLILETPYTSIPDMSNKVIPFIPGKWLLNYHFNNLAKIDKIKCQVHIFAATEDKLTPHMHAVKLAKKIGNPHKILTSVRGAGHGDINTFEAYHIQLNKLLTD